MYIKNILEIKDLKFKKDGKFDKKFKMHKTEKLFDPSWMDIELPEPPANDSQQTKSEINEIIDRREMLSDFDKKVYINTNKDTAYYIKEHLEHQDLEWSEDTIEEIIDSVKHIGRYYKNNFNRPRPRQVAEELGIDKFSYEKLETTNTPAYPSNHALQARMVAHYYGEKYPSQKKYLLKAADMSSEGRVNAGVHYPSDKQAAYMLADKLIEHFKMDELNEDAPMNATGTAVSTDAPIVRKKKKKGGSAYEPSKLFDLLRRNYRT
jgi:acid phosphatase (class A)